MSKGNFVELSVPAEIGDGWRAVGFACDPGPRIRVRLRGPEKTSQKEIDVELDVVTATFVGDLPFLPVDHNVEHLVLEISCELSATSLVIPE